MFKLCFLWVTLLSSVVFAIEPPFLSTHKDSRSAESAARIERNRQLVKTKDLIDFRNKVKQFGTALEICEQKATTQNIHKLYKALDSVLDHQGFVKARDLASRRLRGQIRRAIELDPGLDIARLVLGGLPQMYMSPGMVKAFLSVLPSSQTEIELYETLEKNVIAVLDAINATPNGSTRIPLNPDANQEHWEPIFDLRYHRNDRVSGHARMVFVRSFAENRSFPTAQQLEAGH